MDMSWQIGHVVAHRVNIWIYIFLAGFHSSRFSYDLLKILVTLSHNLLPFCLHIYHTNLFLLASLLSFNILHHCVLSALPWGPPTFMLPKYLSDIYEYYKWNTTEESMLELTHERKHVLFVFPCLGYLTKIDCLQLHLFSCGFHIFSK